MNKYVVLIVLNAPIAIYALLNVVLAYKLKKMRIVPTVLRVLFWGLILLGIFFVKPVSDFLASKGLTNSPPLSIFDVLLVTGVNMCFILIGRAYSRIAELESKFTQLHEKLSIKLSKDNH